MEIAIFPKDCSEDLAAALALTGVRTTPVDSLELVAPESTAEWTVLVVELGDEPMRRLRWIDRLVEETGLPVLVVLDPSNFPLLETSRSVADLIGVPIDPVEFGVRVRRLVGRAGADEVIAFGDLHLNAATYQAGLGEEPLDLTFMEYELLRFLVDNRGRVWTRQQLLSKVWGYDYFGGARTVDVHVRRLRAKLGESRADWITTVRSVGYRFG